MRHFILILICALICSCSRDRPVPSERLLEPAGKFSYVTPDGWFRKNLPGLDFMIVATAPDAGLGPNIFADSPPKIGLIKDLIKPYLSKKETDYHDYRVLSKGEFSTESGLQGIRIESVYQTKDDLPILVFHYLLQDGDRTIIISCRSAQGVKDKYSPIFDTAMESLKSER